MQKLIQNWEETANPNVVFLSCYQMMTGNTLAAIEQQDFKDPAWVDQLLHHFADYYFLALDAYEKDVPSAPRIWQLTFNAANDARTLPLQNLLLGVNAHINYDLAFAVSDLLEGEWQQLSDVERQTRFDDYTHVNLVIAETIDAVQDDVLEPAMPAMDIIDKLFGRFDEFLISYWISEYREAVWENVLRLLAAKNDTERDAVSAAIEKEALKLAEMIYS